MRFFEPVKITALIGTIASSMSVPGYNTRSLWKYGTMT